MNGLPYYKRFPRDFIEGTIGMPFELKVTYSFVLDLIYMQGGKLPDDARYISGLLGVSSRKWKSLRQGLIDAGKLQASDGYLTNYRAIIELENLAKLSRKQSENARNPKKNNDLEKPRLSHTEPEPESESPRVVDVRTNFPAREARTLQQEDPFEDPFEHRPSPPPASGKMPPDFSVPDEWRAWAIGMGMAVHDADLAAVKFVAHYAQAQGRAAISPNWRSTWQKWVCDDLQRQKTRPNGGTIGEFTDDLLDFASRLPGGANCATGMDHRQGGYAPEPLLPAPQRPEDFQGAHDRLDQRFAPAASAGNRESDRRLAANVSPFPARPR